MRPLGNALLVVALAVACDGGEAAPGSAGVAALPGTAGRSASSGPGGGGGDSTRSAAGAQPTSAAVQRPSSTPGLRRARLDTARGRVAVAGSEPAVVVTLRASGVAAPLVLTGGPVALLRRMGGVDIYAEGIRSGPERLELKAFRVRAVDGIPAMDGVLVANGDALALVTDDRTVPIARPPVALREHVGSRVWISGALDREPVAFGVIDSDSTRHGRANPEQ